MKFSIIIPTYNRRFLTKIAIESVLEQNYDDFELIIIDDASTDNIIQILEAYKAYQNFKYIIHNENKGVSAARNSGIKVAQGEWICFLDSDDRFRKDKLQEFAYQIEHHPDYKIFHSNEIWYRHNKLIQEKRKHAKPDGDAFEKSLELCCISPSSVCLHRSLFEQYGLFDEDLPACEDYDMWLRLVYKYPVKLIPQRLTIKEGGHEDQLSSQHSLDKYRIIALSKLINSQALNTKQAELARQMLDRKLEIYRIGCEKNNNLSEYTRLLQQIHFL